MERSLKLNHAAVIVLSVLLTSCASTINLQVRQVQPLPSEENTVLLAGVGKADITPRPGMPMAGYSANANYGKGFRTRLYSRVIYLKPTGGKPVALVQCDLLSGSELVHRKLAELVAEKTDLDLGGIVLSATHTHSGPGNLMGSNFYMLKAANSGGLDVKFLDFVTERIASAVIEAYRNRKPAKLATGSLEVYGFTRNRSIEAYKANANADPVKAADRHKAVNPVLHMVRVDILDDGRGAYVPAGAFTSFSIHGTTVPSDNDLYSGDVFAYMERELEWEMKRKHGVDTFVHAVANSTHADNSPNVKKGRQGFRESRRLGLGLGAKSIELFNSLGSSLRADVKISSALREVDYYKNNEINGIALCDSPRVGNTLLAGASDGGPTPILSWLPFFREGSRRWFFTGGCHGHRRITGGFLQSLVLPRLEFPHVITYQSVRVGDTVFTPLPYEITMESGCRIAGAVKKEAGEGGIKNGRHFIVLSCSNGYTGYCTTPEEYSIQRYEGGHTLYGPNTSPFLAAHAGKLAGEMSRKGSFLDASSGWSYSFTGRTFYRDYNSPLGTRKAAQDPLFIAGSGEEEPCWSFRWEDVPPSFIELHRPLVSVEYSMDKVSWKALESREVPVNDEGYDVAVIFTGDITGKSMAVYETRWYNPEGGNGAWYRFRIEPRGEQAVMYSKEFK